MVFARRITPDAPVRVGVGAPFSATARDRWSPVTLRWSFGDGTSATGGAVSHAFGAAGAFGVTVTAADAVRGMV